MFSLIAKFYSMGLYTKGNIKVFVQGGTITADEYQRITGEAYEVKS